MKRIGIFLLAWVYIISTAGTVLEIHYCMGHISGVHWGVPGSGTMTCCASKTMPGMHDSPCCKTESKVLRVTDVHQPATAYALPLAIPAATVRPLCFLQAPLFSRSPVPVSVAHAPPPGLRSPLFVRNCSFRI